MVLDDNSVVYSSAPGKYDYLDCKGITDRTQANATRTAELTALMRRAGDGAAGPFVSNLVYRDEYNVLQADQLALRQVADEKRCAPLVQKPDTLTPMH